MKYPVRCKIVDVTGLTKKFDGEDYQLNTPDVSKPHIDKEGLAQKIENGLVRINLDDGNIIWGHECWWVPIEEQKKALDICPGEGEDK